MRRQVSARPIAAGQRRPLDAQLALAADGQGFTRLVQHPVAVAIEGLAQQHALLAQRQLHLRHQRPDGGLGGAVTIPQLANQRNQALGQGRIQRLTAA
ncbi:hypothetical protein D3C85_1026060 [compost metagenome]